jgi:hypothetical protein
VANTVNDSAKRFYERSITAADGGTAEGIVSLDSRDANKFQSVANYGTATAPGVGAAIATIASGSLPIGYYKITAEVSIDAGVPAAADRDNMELKAGSTSLKTIIMNPIVSPPVASIEFYRSLDGATAVSINAKGAATASVVYRASITALRIS